MKKILSIIVIAFFSLIASAQVSQTVNVTTPGTLSSLASAYLSTVTNLTVTGNIDARDVKIMRDNMPKLQSLDISGVIIQSYTGNGGTNTDILTTYPVNEIPKYAFHSPNVTTKNGIVESWSTSQNSIISSIIFPISIVSIGDFAFFTSNISGNLLLPSSVTSIGIAAFYECNKITGNLTLSNNINNIGNQAFYGCYYFMGSLTIPASVTNIGVAAFNMCRFTEFVVHSDNKRYLSLNGVLFTANKDTMVMCPRSKIGIIEIPNTVKIISDYTFDNCSGITGSLIIPNSVTYIGNHSFFSCSGLNGNLIIPNSVTFIGTDAFFNTRFGLLTLGNSLITIGDRAFYSCHSFIGSLTLPNSLITIGDDAFYPCNGFTGNLIIPNSVQSIGRTAFSGCTGFTGSLTIPNSVQKISDYAFNGCSGFNGSLSLGNSVDTIGQGAFYGCSGFRIINSYNLTPPSIGGTNTFYGINATLYLPKSSLLVLYKSSYVWSNFTIEVYNASKIYLIIGSNGVIKENNITCINGSPLTIDNGTTTIFSIYPNPGYEVATLTYGGVDVKSQLVNNQYTTPAVNANATLSVTFQKTQYRISQKSAESGTMNLLCEYGATPSFDFTPSAGWKVSTIFYNNFDVTSSLVNGIFTVPAVTDNALLNVAFVSTVTGAPELINSRLKVYTTQSEIIIEGTSEGETITLYTVNGKQLQALKSQGEKIAIPVVTDVVYLVKAAGKTFKVML